MVNVLSDAPGLLDALRNGGGFRRNKYVQQLKAQNPARISKGRPGFAKPINLDPPALSKRARKMNDTMRVAGTQMLQSLMDLNAYNQEGQIMLIQQKLVQPYLDSIAEKSKNLGSNVNQET